MTDNVAVLQGFTEGYIVENDKCDTMFILIKPNTDIDSLFKAWDSDNQEFIFVNGWLWSFTKTDD